MIHFWSSLRAFVLMSIFDPKRAVIFNFNENSDIGEILKGRQHRQLPLVRPPVTGDLIPARLSYSCAHSFQFMKRSLAVGPSIGFLALN